MPKGLSADDSGVIGDLVGFMDEGICFGDFLVETEICIHKVNGVAGASEVVEARYSTVL
jgi:hypothetical protein